MNWNFGREYDISWYVNQFNQHKDKEEYTKLSDKELLEKLKALPEFKSLVLPDKWYRDPTLAPELPEKKCYNMKEFLVEGLNTATAYKNYVGKMDIPAKPGGNRPIIEVQETPAITILENHFSDAPTNHIVHGDQPVTLKS